MHQGTGGWGWCEDPLPLLWMKYIYAFLQLLICTYAWDSYALPQSRSADLGFLTCCIILLIKDWGGESILVRNTAPNCEDVMCPLQCSNHSWDSDWKQVTSERYLDSCWETFRPWWNISSHLYSSSFLVRCAWPWCRRDVTVGGSNRATEVFNCGPLLSVVTLRTAEWSGRLWSVLIKHFCSVLAGEKAWVVLQASELYPGIPFHALAVQSRCQLFKLVHAAMVNNW